MNLENFEGKKMSSKYKKSDTADLHNSKLELSVIIKEFLN